MPGNKEPSALNVFAPVSTKGMIFVILGPPGAGKTTLGRSLARTLGAKFFSTSGFLNELREVATDERLRETVTKHFESGTNADEDEVHRAIIANINRVSCEVMVLDGYPRTPKGAKILNDWAGHRGCSILVVHVFADKPTCRSRFFSKSYQANDEKKFTSRMDHYTTTEREVISSRINAAVINVNTN